MWQRVLRGQLLYVVLGILIVFSYMRVIQLIRSGSMMPDTIARLTAPAIEPAAEGSAVPDDTLEWWPSTLEAEDIERAIEQDPVLGVSLSVLTLFSMGIMLWGFMLTASGLWTGRIRVVWDYASRQLPAWSFGELGRITVLALMVISVLPLIRAAIPFESSGIATASFLWIPVSMLILHTSVVLFILAFAVGKRRSVSRTLGFSSRRIWPSLALGFRSYVAVFPWLIVLLVLTVEVMRFFNYTPPLQPIQELIFGQHGPVVLGLTVVLACVIGPIAEEFFFRGVLYSAIRRRTSRVVAMLISGVLFALIHTNPVGFLPIMVLGCLLANLYERTGSLASSIFVHILHNTFLMSMALVMRRLLLSG